MRDTPSTGATAQHQPSHGAARTFALLVVIGALLAGSSAAQPAVPSSLPHRLYFAEGAAGIFATRYALGNPDPSRVALVALHFLNDDGTEVIWPAAVPPLGRATIHARHVPGLTGAFGVEIRSDLPVVAERLMTWADGSVGSHAERAIPSPASVWHFAEGATLDNFEVFYLLVNPGDEPADVHATYLRPAPAPVLTRSYTVPPRTRVTVWASQEATELVDAEFSAVFHATVPILAERSQYTAIDGRLHGGHAAAGVNAPSVNWYFAEGATGSFFDTFLLLANPSGWEADVVLTYFLPDGDTITRDLAVSPFSRTTVWLNHELPLLAEPAVSTRVDVRNDVPIVAERAMWWRLQDADTREGHASAGSTVAGTSWAVVGGESDGLHADETFVLVTNPGPLPAEVDVVVGYEDWTAPVSQRITVAPRSRSNIWMSQAFPETRGRSYAVYLRSDGPELTPLVVESSVYSSRDSAWSGGRNALASPTWPRLTASETLVLTAERPDAWVDVYAGRLFDGRRFTVDADAAGLVTAEIEADTGRLRVVATGEGSGTTSVVVSLYDHEDLVSSMRYTVVVTGGRIRFGETHTLAIRLPPDFVTTSDGRDVPFGTRPTENGRLEVLDVPSLGLGLIWDESISGRLKDNRLADLNGDGWPDLLAVFYQPLEHDFPARLFFGQPDGLFVEDQAFTALGVRGFGETIVVADFDNDGDLDVFLPFYTHNSPLEQNYLLRNDGTGRFDDVADAAGVAMRNWPGQWAVEGAQAVDLDGDGWIDLFVGSHVFRNNGDLTFTNVTVALGLFDGTGSVNFFDEGAKFLDWNNDGHLDLVLHNPWTGPRLFEFDGVRFTWRQVFVPQDPIGLYRSSFGLNIADLNGDGLEDLVLPGGVEGGSTVVMKNTGTGFVRETTAIDGWRGDVLAFGDIDGDGRLDLYNRGGLRTDSVEDAGYALNSSLTGHGSELRIELVGDNSAQNQAGRVVRISPLGRHDVVFTRVVDGGSGYLSKNPYEMLVPLPFGGPHVVTASFHTGDVVVLAMPGERLRIHRDGSVERR